MFSGWGRPLVYRYYNATVFLIIINVLVFLAESPGIIRSFALVPPEVLTGRWWTLITYMFLHSPNMLSHIIFNMLGLKLFGTPVEREIGSHEFLCMYFVCGIVAGLFAVVLSVNSPVAIIGASGALFSVMVIYATLYPDAVIYAWFFPLRARTAVLLFAGIAVFSTMYSLTPSVSHLTHLGGIVAGFLYCWLRIGKNPIDVFFRRR